MYIRIVTNISRWDGSTPVSRPDARVCGDSITDLRTTKNALSIWKVTDEVQIEESIAVIALGKERLGKVSYVCLDEDFIENKIKLALSVVKGGCKAIKEKEILERHRDIVELDSAQLEQLSYYMLDQVKKSHCDTKDNNDLKCIIMRMISEKKIDPTKINDCLKSELGLS